jgi:hypothetical protein
MLYDRVRELLLPFSPTSEQEQDLEWTARLTDVVQTLVRHGPMLLISLNSASVGPDKFG